MKEYKRLADVLAEALRVKDEEPKSSNAYVMALNTLKESRRYTDKPGGVPEGGFQPGRDANWWNEFMKKKVGETEETEETEGTEETEETEGTEETTPKSTKKKKKKK